MSRSNTPMLEPVPGQAVLLPWIQKKHLCVFTGRTRRGWAGFAAGVGEGQSRVVSGAEQQLHPAGPAAASTAGRQPAQRSVISILNMCVLLYD